MLLIDDWMQVVMIIVFQCYRDLKPQNLLVSNGCVKLADFGLARSIAAAPRRLTTEVQSLHFLFISLVNYVYIRL